MNLLLVLFTLVGVTQVLHQPQLVVQAAAYGPHPELLSHNPNMPSSKGSEFVLGFIGNINYAPTAALLVTTNDPGIVEFAVEYFGRTETFQTRKGRTTLVNLPIGKPGEVGDVRVTGEAERNKGVRIKTTDPTKLLTVYGINDADVSTDAFLALPCHRYPVLTYKYFVFSASTKFTYSTFYSRVLIVACEEDTRVTIRPTQQIKMAADLTGTPIQTIVDPTNPNVAVNTGTFTIGQLATAQFNALDDLTGTIIESDKPISVFVGHECGQIPKAVSACDHLVEQIPPSATWGTRFFTVPLDIRESGERYRIGTVTDDNQVTITCTTEGQTTPRLEMIETIQSKRGKKQYVEFDTIGSNVDGVSLDYRRDFCCIETTKPAIVMMYSKGHSVDEITLQRTTGSQGDPFMLLVPPTSQYSNDYTATTALQVRNDFFGHISYAFPVKFFSNSIVSQRALMINGTIFQPDSGYYPIYCSSGQICGYGAYSGLPMGDHEVRYDIPGAAMLLYVYGISREKSFGYPAGFEMQAIGVPQISIFNVTVLENVGVVRIPINRTGGDLSLRSAIRATSKNGSAVSGYDFVAQSNFRIRWLANQVDPRYIPNPTNVDPIFEFVIINDDTQENLMEYFEIDLALNHRGNARNGVFVPNAVGRVTIVDDDGPPQIGFDSQVYVIDEAAGIVILQIVTNCPLGFSNASGALLYTTDGTATSTQGDFTGISKVNAEPIIFANGQISTTVEIIITDDHLVEGSEHFSAHIISGGEISDLVIFASKATVNITDNDGQ